jgi:quercetin dioxygenase-like cupin family protein
MELLKQPQTGKGPAEMFAGDVWFDVIYRGEEPSRARANMVKFTPGARTAWHAHGLGQTLYIVEGIALIQSRGGDLAEAYPGDIIYTPPAENRTANQALLDHVAGLAAAKSTTPGQIALAWLLAQHPWIAPIPGTRRRERLRENAGAPQVPLSADEVADLNAAAARMGVHGNRYNDLHMSLVGR